MSSEAFLFPTYRRQPISLVEGDGVWVWDNHGNKYLDALAGIAVSSLGHAHPRLTRTIAQQAKRLMHCSNIYTIEAQRQLAERLCTLAGMQRAFFCNSGTEANEAAIKLARLHAHAKGIERPEILVMEHAFHGRTLAALAATGNESIKQGFAPLPNGFMRIPYGDLSAARRGLRRRNVVAVLLEPIQGEGGVNVPPAGYLHGLRELCDASDCLLMLDEIQTGVGRTGHWFAFQHEAIVPDVMSLAKGLGGGFPIGACLAAGKAAALFTPGSHGTTFGGNPLACQAALTVLECIEKQKLVPHADKMGQRLRDRLTTALAEVDGVREIRGKGLMLGIELDRPCAELVDAARTAGLLINVTAGNTIRLLPPLIIKPRQIDQLATTLATLIKAFLKPDGE